MISVVNDLVVPEIPYVSFQDIRDEGITTAIVSDIRLRKLIARYSRIAELYTNQWFGPVFGKAKIDGFDSSIISIDNEIPILKVNNIEVSTSTVGHGVRSHLKRGSYVFGFLSQSEYSISSNKRSIELLSLMPSNYNHTPDYNEITSSRTLFPEGVSNVIVDGVFGYLIDLKEVSALTTVIVNTNDVEIVIDDASLFRSGDIIAIDISGKYYYNIVSSVDTGLNKLFINPSDVMIPTGTKVLSFGSVHPLISYSVMKLVINNRGLIGSTNSALLNPQAMLSEKTDNYTYRLSENIMLESLKGGTGDIEVDRIFNEFRSGGIRGFVV